MVKSLVGVGVSRSVPGVGLGQGIKAGCSWDQRRLNRNSVYIM